MPHKPHHFFAGPCKIEWITQVLNKKDAQVEVWEIAELSLPVLYEVRVWNGRLKFFRPDYESGRTVMRQEGDPIIFDKVLLISCPFGKELYRNPNKVVLNGILADTLLKMAA
jgi:hypothetical protein